MIHVILVEDDLYIQKYFCEKLNATGEFRVVYAVRDAFEAEKLVNKSIGLVLMDVMTLHKHSGLSAGKRIKETWPQVKVVVITSLVDPQILQKARQGCADSLWYKDHGAEELIEIIKRTLSGEHIFPDTAPTVEMKDALSSALSPAQIEMLRLYIRGDTYKEIAAHFHISVSGVRWNFNDMVEKCGFRNKEALMTAAIENKLIVASLEDE